MKPVRLIGGPLELDGLEVPDQRAVSIVMEDDQFVQHWYWVQHLWPEDIWIGEYCGTC